VDPIINCFLKTDPTIQKLQYISLDDNNNNKVGVYGAVIITSHCKISLGSLDEYHP